MMRNLCSPCWTLVALILLAPAADESQLRVTSPANQSADRMLSFSCAINAKGRRLFYEWIGPDDGPALSTVMVLREDAAGKQVAVIPWSGQFEPAMPSPLPFPADGLLRFDFLAPPPADTGRYRYTVSVTLGDHDHQDELCVKLVSDPVSIDVVDDPLVAAAFDDRVLACARRGDAFWRNILADSFTASYDRLQSADFSSLVAPARVMRGLFHDVMSDDARVVERATDCIGRYARLPSTARDAVARAFAHRSWVGARYPNSVLAQLCFMASNCGAMDVLCTAATGIDRNAQVMAIHLLAGHVHVEQANACIQHLWAHGSPDARLQIAFCRSQRHDPTALPLLLTAAGDQHAAWPTPDLVFAALSHYPDEPSARAAMRAAAAGSGPMAESAKKALEQEASWPLTVMIPEPSETVVVPASSP